MTINFKGKTEKQTLQTVNQNSSVLPQTIMGTHNFHQIILEQDESRLNYLKKEMETEIKDVKKEMSGIKNEMKELKDLL